MAVARDGREDGPPNFDRNVSRPGLWFLGDESSGIAAKTRPKLLRIFLPKLRIRLSGIFDGSWIVNSRPTGRWSDVSTTGKDLCERTTVLMVVSARNSTRSHQAGRRFGSYSIPPGLSLKVGAKSQVGTVQSQHAVLLVGPHDSSASLSSPVAFTNAVFYTTVPDVVRVEAPVQIARQDGDVAP